MRGVILLLLFSIPVVIAALLQASQTLTMIAAAPLLLTSLVLRMRRDSPRRSPAVQMSVLVVMGALVVVGGLMALLLWYALGAGS